MELSAQTLLISEDLSLNLNESGYLTAKKCNLFL